MASHSKISCPPRLRAPPTEERSRFMTKVYEAIADAFIAEGATAVFGMMGDANMHWMNAMAERGAKLYEARHEGSGLAMADGWARGSNSPGVATTTSGPGV